MNNQQYCFNMQISHLISSEEKQVVNLMKKSHAWAYIHTYIYTVIVGL